MRLGGLHLQLKGVSDKRVFCEGVLPFEVAAGRPIEFSISFDNFNPWKNLPLSVVWVYACYLCLRFLNTYLD
jgi:hypothetical protein